MDSGRVGGGVCDIPDGEQEYFELQSITLQSLLDETDKNTTELKESLREIIKETCGSLWAFRLAASLNPYYNEVYQSPYVIEHAKIINKTFEMFVANIREASKLLGERLREMMTDKPLKISHPKDKIGDRDILMELLREYLISTSPIHATSHLEKKIYKSMNDYEQYMLLNILSDKERKSYKSIVIDYLGKLYNIQTPGLNNFERRQFIVMLISFGCFPSAKQQEKDWKSMEISLGETPESKFTQTNSYRYFQSRLEKLYNYLGNPEFKQLRYITLLSTDTEMQKLKYDRNCLLMLSNAVNHCIKNDIQWEEIEEMQAQNKAGTISLVGFKIETILSLNTNNTYTKTLEWLIEEGYDTLKSVVLALYNGEMGLECKENDSYTFKPSFIGLLNVLKHFGLAELLVAYHKNSSVEERTKQKYIILGYDKNWLLNSATLSDEPFKSSLSEGDRWKLAGSVENTPINRIVKLYNIGLYTKQDLCIQALRFRDVLNRIGYGELLEYNYELWAKNVGYNEKEGMG